MRISTDSLIKTFFITASLGLGISYGKIYLFHFVFGALFFLYFTGYFKSLSCSKPSDFHKMMAVMAGWFALSIIWSWDRWASLLYLVYITIGAGIVFVAVNYSRNLQRQEKIFRALACIALIELTAAFLESTGFFRLPVSPYSNYVHVFGREMGVDTSMEQDILATYLNLPTGFEWNPNNLGAKMVILLPFFLLMRPSWWRRCGLLGVMSVVVLSGSRGALLAALFVVAMYVLLYRRFNLRFMLYLVIGAIALACTIRFLDVKFLTEAFTAFVVYLSMESLDPTASIGIRQQLMLNGLDALLGTYGLGIGGGADLKMQEMYNNTFYGGMAEKQILSMHNFWVEILVNGGVLFFVVFIAWYIALTWRLYRISKRASDVTLRYYASSSALALAGFSLASISASSVIYFFPMWLLFGFSIATVNNYFRLESKKC